MMTQKNPCGTQMNKDRPSWTIHYKIPNISWLGSGWEFFDDKESAEEAFRELKNLGRVVILRPYKDEFDQVHLGSLFRLGDDRYEKARRILERVLEDRRTTTDLDTQIREAVRLMGEI